MHLRNLVRFSVHWWHKVFAYMWSSWPSGTFFQLILFIAAKLERKRRRNKQKRLRKKEKKKEQQKTKTALGKEELIFGMSNVGRTGYSFLCGGIAHDLISMKFSPILFMRLKTKGKDVIGINVLPRKKKEMEYLVRPILVECGLSVHMRTSFFMSAENSVLFYLKQKGFHFDIVVCFFAANYYFGNNKKIQHVNVTVCSRNFSNFWMRLKGLWGIMPIEETVILFYQGEIWGG